MTEKSALKSKKFLIPLILAVVFIAILSYFLMWRPSDNDYQAASGLATYTEKTHRVLTVELSTIEYPGRINASTPIKLQVLANAYKNAVDALNQNGAINRDPAVQSTYGKNKQALVEHSQSMVKLASSVKLYTDILDKCKQFTDSITNTKSATYDSLLDDCHSALSAGASSGHKTFNDLFFTEYREQTTKYIDSLDKLMNALDNETYKNAKSSVDESYQALRKLGEVELKFESPNVIGITKDLNTILDSQKKAFLR